MVSRNTEKFVLPSRAKGLRDAPALTLMESPAFRVRMGTARPSRTPTPKSFIGRIKSMVRQHAAGAGGGKARRLSQFGRGGSAAAGIAVRSFPQRVTVKSRVVRHSKYSGLGGAAAALREHVQYLGRRGVATEGGRGVLFDADGDLSPADVREFREGIVDDRHHFRFIVSPEAGSALDLQDYAREFVATLEADLGTPLQWLGVAHYDTDNPHLHLLVRGKDDHGGDLVINRDYMSHGMRLQAMELATRHLGPRLAEDIERSLKRDLKADRVTGIDLRLAQAAATHPHGWVTALRSNDGSLARERQRLHTLTRLQHLESVGLAREVGPGIWQPDIDLLARLRALSTRGDIIKLMHERMRGGNPSLSTVIFNKEHPPTTPVTGRVYGRGTVDELSDRHYLLVEARDGQAYYVPVGDYSEVPGQETAVGAIVTIAPAPRGDGTAADRQIARIASQHGGVYDAVVHAGALAEGAWLPPGVGAADYVNAHLKRAKALASRGVVEALGKDRFRVPPGLAERIHAMPPAARDSGGFIQVKRLSEKDLESQVTVNGVTWLDQELQRGAALEGAARVGASRFERQLATALKDRAAHLQSLSLAQEIDGELRLRARFLDDLYERELQDAGRRLQGRYGELTRLQAGREIRGRIEGIEQLPSGPHVLLVSPSQFSLVPAASGLARSVNKTVSLSVGRVRSLNPAQPETLQLSLRYRELTPTRGIRR
jgi:type IV secretory pathway VirD2 relaxase